MVSMLGGSWDHGIMLESPRLVSVLGGSWHLGIMGSGDKNSSFSYLFQSRTQNPLALWSADGHNSGGIEKKKIFFVIGCST